MANSEANLSQAAMPTTAFVIACFVSHWLVITLYTNLHIQVYEKGLASTTCVTCINLSIISIHPETLITN